MKIIYLNAFNADLEQEFRAFLVKHTPDTDVFCFQEAYDRMREITSKYMGEFELVHDYALAFGEGADTEDFALATYVRKSHKLISSEVVVNADSPRGLGIDTLVEYNGRQLRVFNYHGVSVPREKLDTPDRLRQSKELAAYLQQQSGPMIIGGDFNILPETESYSIIKSLGYGELVMDRHIDATVNEIYWGEGPSRLHYSDYIFVTNDIKVDNFEVPYVKASDHLPLILDVDL